MDHRALVFVAGIVGACTTPEPTKSPTADTASTTDTGVLIPGCVPGAYGTVVDHVEVFTARPDFDAALSDYCGQTIDFDDIAVAGDTPEPFAADRYLESHGVRITGTDGQYVHPDWGYDKGFDPVSLPNSYAPGPPNIEPDPGGHETTITFEKDGAAAHVAAIGIVFIDADYGYLGPSSIEVFDGTGASLGTSGTVKGADGSHEFRGLVAVDAAGLPVPAFASATVINGNEWPERDVDEDVALDDLRTDPPQ